MRWHNWFKCFLTYIFVSRFESQFYFQIYLFFYSLCSWPQNKITATTIRPIIHLALFRKIILFFFLNLSKLITANVLFFHSFVCLIPNLSIGSLLGPVLLLGLWRLMRQGFLSEQAQKSVTWKFILRKCVIALYMICLIRHDLMYHKHP